MWFCQVFTANGDSVPGVLSAVYRGSSEFANVQEPHSIAEGLFTQVEDVRTDSNWKFFYAALHNMVKIKTVII